MYRCVGCDKSIPWNGKSAFSYTCPCGAAIFYDGETGGLTVPGSVAIGIGRGQTTPHLNDLVGESTHTSPIKEQVISELQSKGFIWMEECEQCKQDGTLKRKQEREVYLTHKEAESIIRRQQ